jgi:Asp-tRNA(Asn)/Glu-tRNA(Gln) amidotransferase A subunit family amidase
LEKALQGQKTLRAELDAAMKKHAIDLWLSPSAVGPAPKGLDSTGDPVMNLPWTHAGVPTVTLPSGFNTNGLPLGLQVAAHWYGDEALLAWAPQLEKALKN